MGFVLAAAAALLFAVLDVLRKLLGRHLSAIQIVAGLNLGTVLVVGGILFLEDGFTGDATFLMVASAQSVLHATASVLYVRAVTLSPLSLTIPYLGLTPVISAGFGYLTLGEVPRPSGLLGILIVVVGLVLLHAGQGRNLAQLLRAPLEEPGSWRMLLVALIWGCSTPLDKISIAHSSELMLALALALGGLVLLSGPLFKTASARVYGRPASSLPLLALAVLVLIGAVLCQFFAYRELLVSYVETIKRSGGLISVVFGAVFFGETGIRQRLLAVATLVLGIVILTLG